MGSSRRSALCCHVERSDGKRQQGEDQLGDQPTSVSRLTGVPFRTDFQRALHDWLAFRFRAGLEMADLAARAERGCSPVNSVAAVADLRQTFARSPVRNWSRCNLSSESGAGGQSTASQGQFYSCSPKLRYGVVCSCDRREQIVMPTATILRFP